MICMVGIGIRLVPYATWFDMHISWRCLVLELETSIGNIRMHANINALTCTGLDPSREDFLVSKRFGCIWKRDCSMRIDLDFS